MFWQSTAMHLRRRGTAGGAMAFVIYVFLVMVSIAMAQAQDSAPRGVFIRPPRDAVTFFDSAGIGGSKGD